MLLCGSCLYSPMHDVNSDVEIMQPERDEFDTGPTSLFDRTQVS